MTATPQPAADQTTTTSETTRVGVIGLGTMGAGIAEVFARAGLEVVGVESTAELADRGRGVLERSTAKAVQKGRLEEPAREKLLARVRTTDRLEDLADVDLVVEAVPETMAIKADLIARLDAVLREDAVLASNTSSLSITEMAGLSAHPGRVVGMHFFNPAPVLPLVEVITTVRTDPQVQRRVADLAVAVGKHPVVVGDRPGFVANYLLFGYLNRALQMVQRGHASIEDIDTAMRVGVGLPMGPFTLMDLVGLDVCHHIGEVIYRFSRSRVHAPSTLLEQYVAAGRLGRKSGRGFYDHGVEAADPGAGVGLAPAAPTALAVLGEGEVADALADAATRAGLDLVHVVGPEVDAAALGRLSTVPLVVDAGPGESADLDPLDPSGSGAVAEDEPRPDGLLARVAGHLAPDAVVAGAAGESALATALRSRRPERAVSLTLHEPTRAGQVMEIGTTVATDPEAVRLLRATVEVLGGAPVVCRDRPGLVVDALLVPHLFDAVDVVDSGYASARDVDAAAELGLGYPTGPLAMVDSLGAADLLAAAEYVLGPEAGWLEPPPLLVEHAVLGLPFHPAGPADPSDPATG